MRKRQRKERKNRITADLIKRGVCFVLLICSLLAVTKTIFVSLDIDESYALAVGYRLATGERLFWDLWESHQLGGIFLAPFIWLYLKLAGTTGYLVIYARVIGTLIHVLIGIFLYKTARQSGEMKKEFSLLLFFLHLNFLPKWVQCPEFELQQYWFILLIFLCFYRFYQGEGKRNGYPVLAGVLLVGQMFSYPSLILLYPVYILGIFQCGKEEEKKKKIKQSILFTAGSLAAGILFLAYLGSYLTPETFLENAGYIFRDESHTLVSTAVKWKIFGAQFLEMLPMMSGVLGIALAGGFVFTFVKNRHISEKAERWKEGFFPATSLFLFLSGALQGIGCLFGNENQFFMQWRFFALSLIGLLMYLMDKSSENRRCLWFGILPGFMTLLSVLILTNMDVNTSMSKMYIGVIAVVWMLGRRLETEEEIWMPISERGSVKVWNTQKTIKWEKGLLWTGALFFLAGLLVCKLVQMRVSGCMEITVLAPMKRIEAGPAKGIYMVRDTAIVLEDDYRVLTEHLSPEDKLLYIGSENIVYLWTGAQVATPSTQGTNAYNDMFIRYYWKYPEKIPTVIAVDKELGENPAYYDSPRNHIIYEWMDQMGYQEILDAAYMKLYRR